VKFFIFWGDGLATTTATSTALRDQMFRAHDESVSAEGTFGLGSDFRPSIDKDKLLTKWWNGATS
jgi:hypothetical protein